MLRQQRLLKMLKHIVKTTVLCARTKLWEQIKENERMCQKGNFKGKSIKISKCRVSLE